MGWVTKRPNGRYRASYRDADGRMISKTFDRKGKNSEPNTAAGWLATIGHSQQDQTYTDPRDLKRPFSELWDTYMAGTTLRPSTASGYRRHYRLYIAPTFAQRQIGSVRAEDVRRWRTELENRGVGASTIRGATKLLRAVFARAVQDGLLARSPVVIRNASTDPRGGLRVLEVAELNRLAAEVPDRYRTLVLLLGYRGLRIGEATGLRVGEVDTIRGRVTISRQLTEVDGVLHEGPPKTDAGRRVVSLPPFLRDALVEHIARYSDPTDPDAPVFTGDSGGLIRASNFRRRAFRQAVAEAGLDPKLTPHDLRDTAATLALSHGATVREVADLLGHSSPVVTLNRYTGALESFRQRTDDRLDAAFRNETSDPAAYVLPGAAQQVVQLPDRDAVQAL